jgi:hypothetical protein
MSDTTSMIDMTTERLMILLKQSKRQQLEAIALQEDRSLSYIINLAIDAFLINFPKLGTTPEERFGTVVKKECGK